MFLKDKVKQNQANQATKKTKYFILLMYREEEIERSKEDEYWNRMKRRIDNIQKDKLEIESISDMQTRKFLLLNIMPILTSGMLEVCKINPIDPIDYLADYLFKNSTD